MKPIVCMALCLLLACGCTAPREGGPTAAPTQSVFPGGDGGQGALTPSGFTQVNTLPGVSLRTAQAAYPPDIEELYLLWENGGDAEYTYGEWFVIERQEDGAFYTLPYRDSLEGEPAFHSIGYLLRPAGTAAQQVPAGFLYPPLQEGTYRVVKEILVVRAPGDFDEHYLTAEFTIEPDAPQPIGEIAPIAALEASAIAYIERYDNSHSPDVPARVWASPEEIAQRLSFLQSIRLIQKTGDESPAKEVPGGASHTLIHLFDGGTLSLEFALDTISFGQGYYTYAHLPHGDADLPLGLRLERRSYPAGTQAVNYTVFNQGQTTAQVTLIPELARMTPSGWEEVPLKAGAGFCGMPDPVPATGLRNTLPLSLFPEALNGTFRLSFRATDGDGIERVIADVFTLEKPE